MRNKKIYAALLCGLIVVVLVLGIILYGWLHMLKETSNKDEPESQTEVVPNFGTENILQSSTENVPNFGTSLEVDNIDEMAAPLLKNGTEILEKELSEYVLRNGMAEEKCTIIHVMIPEQNENQMFIFCQFAISEEIVQVVFDREKNVWITLKSYYSREDILNEMWNGDCPSDRDIQE